TQRFSRIQFWRPHVAGAVTHQSLVRSLSVAHAVRGHAFVINADLFRRFDIVVQDHFAAAGDQGTANLDRRQPVEVKVSDELVRKEQHQVRNVFYALFNVTATQGTYHQR